MRVGITGHQRLDDPPGWLWVRNELDRILAKLSCSLEGITSLAIGTDQVFADEVLRKGGSLVVIIPFQGYESKFAEGHDRNEYLRLLMAANEVKTLQKLGSDEESYFAAGKMVVELSDLLLAVWDGKPAAGLGGTADVVDYAKHTGIHWIHLNPARRTMEKGSKAAKTDLLMEDALALTLQDLMYPDSVQNG